MQQSYNVLSAEHSALTASHYLVSLLGGHVQALQACAQVKNASYKYHPTWVMAIVARHLRFQVGYSA